MISVSIHLHKNILSGQCQIRLEDDQNNTDVLHVDLNNTCLNISLLQNEEPRNKFEIVAPIRFFIPSSVSEISQGTSLKIENERVTLVNNTPAINPCGTKVFDTNFRFQIPNAEVLQCTESTDIEISILNKKFNDLMINTILEKKIRKHIDYFFKEVIKPKTLLQIHCTNCDIPVGEAIFVEVEEYYVDSLTEGWFCHPSDTVEIVKKLSKDCLYMDETSFLFQEGFLRQNRCDCDSKLGVEGSKPEGFVRVYFDKIVFRSSEVLTSVCDLEYTGLSMNPRTAEVADRNSAVEKAEENKAKSTLGDVGYTGENVATQIKGISLEYRRWLSLLTLWSLIERSQTNTLFSRILLQSKPNRHGADTCLFLIIPTERAFRFRLRGSSSEIPPRTDLRTESVFKVLFLIGSPASNEFKHWKHAFGIDYYPVSDTTMDTLSELLLESAEKDAKSADLFLCGYLPASPLKI